MTTKRTRVAGRSIAVGIAGIAALIANACGSDSSSGEEKGCEPQSTRECVGPAACKGGQVCGADGKWGACDCGGGTGGSGSGGTGGTGPGGGGSGGTGGSSASGGSGGVAGAGGTGAPGGAGGSSAAGGTGASTSGGTGGVSDAGDASTDPDAADAYDTSVGPNDDPCPADPINVNCSTSCGPKTPGCWDCGYQNYFAPITDQLVASHFVIRTPSPPFGGTSCTLCDGGAGAPPVYRMRIYYKGVPGAFRIKVGKPWKVWAASSWNDTTGSCLSYYYANGCESADIGTLPGELAFYIGTDDPNAPARNVVIEKYTGTPCTAADYWQ